MKLLLVIVAVFCYRTWRAEHPLRSILPFQPYYALWTTGWFTKRVSPLWRYMFCIGLPSLVLLALSFSIHHWWQELLWLAAAWLILIYAIAVDVSETQFTEQCIWLRAVSQETSMADVTQRQQDFELAYLYTLFQNIVPALFYFLLLGPGGALFYTLTIMYINELAEDDPILDKLGQVVFWLDWLPARLTGLLFALVGNFGPSFDYWLTAVVDTKVSNAQHLVSLATLAVEPMDKSVSEDVLGFAELAQHHLIELQALYGRALLGWIGFAAMVVVIGS